MLADFLTKPLQGNLFRVFRDMIMGYKHSNTLSSTHSPGPEERVGKSYQDQINDLKQEASTGHGQDEYVTQLDTINEKENDKDTWSVVERKKKARKGALLTTNTQLSGENDMNARYEKVG
jgi:hypothetical protein